MLAIAAACASWLTCRPASADTQACVTSHASGQREAKAGRLKLASELFTACGSDSACPEQLRAECTELLEKTRAATPSVILSVLDEKGGDVSAVKVFSTDELIADGLDGRALALDPGKHRLRFLLPWGDVLSSDVLIREGEKNRLIQVKIEPKAPKDAPAAPAAAPPPAPVTPPPAPPLASPPVGAWVATGVAVAGAGVFGTFAFLGSRQKADLDECAPACPRSLEDTRDKLKTSYLIADIGLGAAVVSSAVAIYLFASHGSSENAQPSAARGWLHWNAGLAAGPRGAGFALSGDFR
ncbi:MAG: hypothetical protein ABUL60_17475 [Myxococcales bacterium]